MLLIFLFFQSLQHRLCCRHRKVSAPLATGPFAWYKVMTVHVHADIFLIGLWIYYYTSLLIIVPLNKEGSLVLCPFNKIVVVGLPLGSMSSPTWVLSQTISNCPLRPTACHRAHYDRRLESSLLILVSFMLQFHFYPHLQIIKSFSLCCSVSFRYLLGCNFLLGLTWRSLLTAPTKPWVWQSLMLFIKYRFQMYVEGYYLTY